jgi:hypothetical protein
MYEGIPWPLKNTKQNYIEISVILFSVLVIYELLFWAALIIHNLFPATSCWFGSKTHEVMQDSPWVFLSSVPLSNMKQITLSVKYSVRPCHLLLNFIFSGLHHAKQHQPQFESPTLAEEPQSHVTGAFSEQGGPGAAPLTSGSSILWLTQGTQER